MNRPHRHPPPPTAQGPPESDASRLGTGSSIVLVGLGFGRGLRLLTRVLIGRLLGAASLGVFDLAWTLVQILAFPARGGLHIAVVRFGSSLWNRGRRRAFRRLVGRSLLVPLLLGGLAAVALALVAPWLATEVFHAPELKTAIRIFAPLLPLASALAVLAGGVQATQRMPLTVLTRDLVEPGLQFLAFLGLWVLGFGLAAALWGMLIGGVIAFLVGLLVFVHLTSITDSDVGEAAGASETSVRDLIAFSVPVAVSGLLGAYLLWIDRLVVGIFMDVTQVGIYAAAAQFGILFALVLHGFSTMFAPMFADLQDRGEHQRMRELYRVSTKWGLYLLLPLAAVMAVVPETVLGGVFGREFIAGSRALRILLIGQLVNVASGHVGLILILAGRQRIWMALNAVAVALNLTLDLVWIPRFGLAGAAAASSLALTFLFSAGLVYAYRSLRVCPFDRRFVKLLPPALAALVGLYWLRTLQLIPATVSGFLMYLFAAYAIAAVCRLLLPYDPEDREFLSVLRGKLPIPR